MMAMREGETILDLKHSDELRPFLEKGLIEEKHLYYHDVLYCALESVESSEIKSKTPYSEGKEEEYVELHISSELQYHYRNILKNNINSLELRYGLEIRKHLSENAEKVLTDYDIQPDFVIHKNNESFDCQLIAGEVKRQSVLNIENFARDINKLLLYKSKKIWGGNPFLYSVFIVFSTNKEIFLRSLRNFLRNEKEIEFRSTDGAISRKSLKVYLLDNIEDIKQIFCFLYQQENCSTVYTLYDIVYQELSKTK